MSPRSSGTRSAASSRLPASHSVLHRLDVVGEALPGERRVVEVLVLRAHRTDRERVAAGVACGGLLDVVGELDGDGHHEVEVGDRPASLGGAGAKRLEEGLGVLGHEGVAEPTVGQLTGQLEVARTERGDVDRDVGRAAAANASAALAVGQRDLVAGAVVGQAVAPSDPPARSRSSLCVAPTGAEKRTPCQPSITCGPLVPMPSRKRPPDSACMDIAVIARLAGVRAPSWAMPVARPIVVVRAAR